MAGDSAREQARRQREKAARLERSAEMWERGAQGEAATASALQALAGPSWAVFHDVRWPGRQRANIDHVVVGPTGVFVIDSKNWSGDVRAVGDVLYQGSRRREREVAAAADAALAVTQLLQGLPATPVLCFVRAEPIEGQARDVMVCSTQNLAARLAAQPPVLGPESIKRVTSILQWQLTTAMRPSPAQPSGRTARSRKRVQPVSSPRRPPTGSKVVRRMFVAAFGLLLAMVALGAVFAFVGSVVDGVRQGAEAGAGAPESSAAPTLGDLVRLPAGSSHPPLQVKADKVMRVGTTKPDYALQRDKHLVAVRFSIRNEGTELWGATAPYLRFFGLASDGQHVSGGSFSDLPSGKLMPAAFNLRPGKVRRGFVVLAVPDGAKLVRVSIRTDLSSSDDVVWLIP